MSLCTGPLRIGRHNLRIRRRVPASLGVDWSSLCSSVVFLEAYVARWIVQSLSVFLSC